MRKIKFSALVLILLFGISALSPVFAASDAGNLGAVPIAGADITIDGVKDALYDQGLQLPIGRRLDDSSGDSSLTGKASLLWTDKWLYVFVDINDPVMVEPDPDKQENTPWETDSVEVFLDLPNEGTSADVNQYRIDITGWPSYYDQTGVTEYGPDAVGSRFAYGYKRAADNYQVEFKVPIADKRADAKIGFNIQVNDVHPDYQVILYCPSSLNTNSWTAELYDYITLGSTLVKPAEVVTAEAPAAPADNAPAPLSPKTGDTGIVALFALAAVSVVSFAAVRKNRSR